MQKKLTTLLFILTLFILTGCTGDTNKKEEPVALSQETSPLELQGSLTISIGSDFDDGNFDPCTGYGIFGYDLFHTSLLKITTDVKIECDLAKDYTVSDDGLIYTFTLRDDVKFSDGKSLRPEDVVFTFNTAKNKGSSVDLTMMEKAQVIDDNKVSFTLNKAYSPFTRTIALLGIVPEHAYSDNYPSNPIGTGPFKVKQMDMGQQLIVEPNEYYYGTKSHFKQITFLSIDEETALAAAKSGQLDVVMVNPEYASETVEGMYLETIKTSDNRGFNLPCIPETINAAGETVGNNVTSDPVVRKALNMGISRQEIIDNALSGIGTPSWIRFQGLPWANEEPEFIDGQVEEAKALLEKAGWVDTDDDGIREKDGLKCEFRITGRTDDLQRYNLAVALSENAKPLGINIIAEARDWTTCTQIARSVPTCIGTGDYSFIDVYNAFHSSFSGVDLVNLSNSAMYANITVDQYLEAMIAATSEDEAIEFCKKAQYDGNTGANADFPYIWLVNIDHTYFVRDGLDIGIQRIHPHGHGAPIIQNLNEWRPIQ